MELLWMAAEAEMTRKGCWAALSGAKWYSAAHILMAHDSEHMAALSHSPDSHCSYM